MKYLIKYLLFIFTALICLPGSAQKINISSQTKNIIASIAKINVYETAVVPEETKTKQLENYLLLKSTASDEELIKLTDHRNGVVRVYAFKALSERQYSGLFNIIIKHVDDNKLIKCVFHGYDFVHTVISTWKVGDFIISYNNLTESEKESLDSILIFSNNSLRHTNNLLAQIKPDNKYYEQIRKHVQNHKFDKAVIALSKYKKREDINLIAETIKKYPYSSVSAIEYFPDTSFKEVLNYLHNNNLKPYKIYSAVAVYKDSFAYDYLEKSITESAINNYYKESKAKEIYIAIQKYRCPLYNELFFQLWKNDFIINDSILRDLIILDRERCIEYTISSLKQPNKLDNNRLIIFDLLDFLIENDSASAKSVIKLNIDSTDVLHLKYFVEKAKKINDKSIVNSMFYRLENTSNGHIYVPIVETLLSYNNKDVNNRLIKSLKDNPELNGWGLEKVLKNLAHYNLKL